MSGVLEVISLEIKALYKKAEWYMYNYHEIKNKIADKRSEMQRMGYTTHDGLKDPTGKIAIVNIIEIKSIHILKHSSGQSIKKATVLYPERIIEAVDNTLKKASTFMRRLVEAKYIYKRPWEQTASKENISKDTYYDTIKEFLFLLLLHLVEAGVFKVNN